VCCFDLGFQDPSKSIFIAIGLPRTRLLLWPPPHLLRFCCCCCCRFAAQVQYRMHPCLSAFPNAAFYSGRLTDGVAAGQRPSAQPFPWPQPGLPLLFVDVAEGAEEVAAGGSKLNRAEADVVQQVCHRSFLTNYFWVYGFLCVVDGLGAAGQRHAVSR
jgi:hypothetical protein